MRRMFLAIGIVLSFAVNSLALSLQWDANPAVDQVTQYSVWQASAAAGPWTKTADLSGTNYQIVGLTPGIYYFQVTATNVWGESGPSNIVSTPSAVPALPKNLKIIAVIIGDDGTVTFRLVDPAEFFRS